MSDPDHQTLVFGGPDGQRRSVRSAMWRGMRKRCPNCGKGRLFAGYTRVRETCPNCGQDFKGQRADDAPPYFTMFLSGHIVIPLAVEVKRRFDPPLGLQFLAFGLLLAFLTWYLLPVTKGALIGIQWANRMHGFGHPDDPDAA